MTELQQRFEFRGSLGAGATGTVERAFDRERNQEVALKLLRPAAVGDPVQLAENFAELKSLVHTGVVRHLDHEFASATPWYTMAIVDGTGFRDYVRGTPLPQTEDSDHPLLLGQATQPFGQSRYAGCNDHALTRLLTAGVELGDALAYLHAHGWVHRDLKPDNVRVTDEGTMLIDFGLALELQALPEEEEGPLSDEGWVGTPAYMAPEQWENEQVSPAADCYSVGVLIFEALTGELPFAGNAQEMLVRKRTVGAPRPSFLVSGVPELLDDLCAELLHTNAHRRPEARAISQRLKEARNDWLSLWARSFIDD